MDGHLGSPARASSLAGPFILLRCRAEEAERRRSSSAPLAPLSETSVNSAYSAELNNGTHSSAERLNSQLNASRASVNFPAPKCNHFG